MHLLPSLDVGGVEKVVYDLTRLANRDQFDVQVVCIRQMGSLATELKAQGVRVLELDVVGKGRLFFSACSLAKLLKSAPVDVVHSHSLGAHIVVALARLMARIPVSVYTRHNGSRTSNWILRTLSWFANWSSESIVAVSRDAATVCSLLERVPGHKLRVIENGIDLEKFQTDQESLPCNNWAIHVARLHDPPKDHATLLRATRFVVDQIPDFHLEIVGDGPDRGRLELIRDELQLQEHVTFSGVRNDVRERLARSQLAILSSLTEGLSIALLEAMAMGRPVVATAVGGNPELVAHEKTGLLVPPQDPVAMSRAIIDLVRSPTKAAAFGAAGRQRVEESFCLDRVVDRYSDLYLELLSHHARSPARTKKTPALPELSTPCQHT